MTVRGYLHDLQLRTAQLEAVHIFGRLFKQPAAPVLTSGPCPDFWLNAGGDFIANWTLTPGTRRNLQNAAAASSPVIQALYATCANSGLQLKAVAAPPATAQYSIEISDPMVVVDDGSAHRYQYYVLPGQVDVSQPNPRGGFRAVWLA